MHKNTLPIILILTGTVAPALAQDSALTVVPAIEMAFKNNQYSVPAVDVDLKFTASFTTLAPSLTVAYGRFYGLVNRDVTIDDSEKYLYGTDANPGFAAIRYDRMDTAVTFGYRLVSSLNLYTGYTEGKGTLLLASIDDAGAAFDTTRIYKESGYYLGASYSFAFSANSALNIGAAYGSLDGLLVAGADSQTAKIRSKAPGYSLNLAWIQSASKTLSYRIGAKYTSYTFEGNELRENGVEVPIPRAFDYFERITTFYVGVSNYF